MNTLKFFFQITMKVTCNKRSTCESQILVSVVIPVYNAEQWLDAALESICQQTWRESLEVSIYDDASTDSSRYIIDKWKIVLEKLLVKVTIGSNKTGKPSGVGAAKNAAIRQSNGKYICFFDSDDVMLSKRLELQLKVALALDWNTIIGCNFERVPDDSTPRYTTWHNSLSQIQLSTQIYTSFGPTLIQPTWFCSRDLIEYLGYFDEIGKGHPEDLTFFYKHLKNNGKLYRVQETLLLYRYHENAASFSVSEETIWDIRLSHLEVEVLSKWQNFTIWNAGKQGRRFYRSLTQKDRGKVLALCDVDEKKISKGEYR
ncbi:queuosine-tRNA galactosyltransferase-like isoform X2 [Rhopilema esculentum]